MEPERTTRKPGRAIDITSKSNTTNKHEYANGYLHSKRALMWCRFITE